MSSPYRPAFEPAQQYRKKKTPEERLRKSGEAFSLEGEEDDIINETVTAIAADVARRQADRRREFMEEWHRMVFVVGAFAEAQEEEQGKQQNAEEADAERAFVTPARQGDRQKRPSHERRPCFEGLENRSLLDGTGELFSVLPPLEAFPQPNAIVARLKLDEAGGLRIDSKSINTLTDQNNTVGSAVDPSGQRVADFEKDNAGPLFISDAQQNGLDFEGGNFTFSFWLKVEDAQSGTDIRSLVYKYAGAADRSYALYHIQEGGIHEFDLILNSTGRSGGDGHAHLPFVMPVGEWFHATITHDATNGGAAVLYINGVEQARASTGKTSVYNGGADFKLGSNDAGEAKWDGLAIDVLAWNVAQSPSEAAVTYAAYFVEPEENVVTPLPPPPTDPVPPPPDETGGGNAEPTPEAPAIPAEGLLLRLPAPKNLEHTEALKLGSAFTISFWANADQLYDSGDMLSAGEKDKNLTFVTGADGSFLFGIGTGERGGQWGKFISAPAGTLKAGTWQHIVGTYDRGKIELFVDETFIGSAGNPEMDLGELPLNIAFRSAEDGIYYPWLKIS